MLVITGGAGFLGSALLWGLNARGIDEAVVVDNLGESSKWRNLVKRRYVDYLHRDRFMELVRGRRAPWKVDAIIHLGACSSTTETNADFLMENNFHYSRDLCRFALETGARFINASSAATYGAGELGFSDNPELVPRLRPLNMYGYSKQLFDLWLLREGLADQVASLKFFNVYGPNEYHKGAMASVAFKAFHRIRESGAVSLFESGRADLENGEQKRDFVYVKDCVRLMEWLLLDKWAPGIRNVGTGKAASFNELAKGVFSAMRRPVKIGYAPMPAEIAPNYQSYTQADMSWLGKFGYPHKFLDVAEGTRDYVREYLEKKDPYL